MVGRTSFVFAGKSVEDLRMICKGLKVACRGNRAAVIARLTAFSGKSVEDLRMICKGLKVACRGNRAAVIARLTAFSVAEIHAEWVKGMNTRARHRTETHARKRTRCNRRGAENTTKQKQQQQKDQKKEDKERTHSIPVRKLASLILPDHIKRRQTKPDRFSPSSTPEDDDESCWENISLDESSDLFEYPESIDDNDSIVEVCSDSG
eukprot:s5756_g2.t1